MSSSPRSRDGGDVLEAADEAMSSSPERARDPVQRLAAASAARALESRRLADSIETDGDDRLELLRDSLVTASRRDGVTAIRTIALLRDSGAISTALENLSEADAAQRANALEVIETIGDRRSRSSVACALGTGTIPTPRGRLARTSVGPSG